MLFFLNQDRSYLNEEPKPDDILRVTCVGDSMTYGQGCLITETLPFHLERILNSVLWNQQVEVVNGGVCGYSIHDAWGRYLDKFLRFQSNLVVITICDNDAELYNHREAMNEREQQMNYVEFSEACYAPNGEHFPYFRLLLEDIARYARDRGTPVIIAFYDIHGGLHRQRIAPIIRDACRDSNLPFADLSQDFLDTAAATHNPLLKVSQTDAHPSAIAHQIAARRLARTIFEYNLLPKSSDTIIPEPDMVQNCLDRADRMVKIGVNPGKAFFFLKRSLAAKRDSRVRLQLSKNDLLSEESYKKFLNCLDITWQRFLSLCVWESYYGSFRVDIDQFNLGLRLCHMALARLAKTLFVLEKRFADLSLPIVNDFQKIFQREAPLELQNFPALVEKFARWEQKHKQAQAFAERTFGTLKNTEEDRLFPNANAWIVAQLKVLERQVQKFWCEVEAILASVEKHLACYSKLAEKISLGDRDSLMPTLARAYWLLEDTLNHFNFCLTAIRYETLSLLAGTSKQEIQSCLTLLQVTLIAPEYQQTFSNNEPLSLEVQIKSFVPFNQIVSDIQTIVQDGLPHVYSFELPFFLEAELRIGLKGGQAVQINTVCFSNAKNKLMVLSPNDFVVENEGQIYRYPRVFVPL